MKNSSTNISTQKSGKTAVWLPIVLVVVALAVVVIVLIYSGYFKKNNVNVINPVTTPTTSAATTQAGDKFAISINTDAVFPTASDEGNLNIINPSSNSCDMIVQIYTADNQLIYKSDVIKSGQHVEKAKLLKILAKGKYDATAYFLAYTPNTQEYIGKVGAKLKITILN